MAVIVTVEIPGGTQEQYEETMRLLEATEWWPPTGFIAHAEIGRASCRERVL